MALAKETGGSAGVRDEELLESALETVFSWFGVMEFYPTNEEIWNSTIKAHTLVNK